MHVNRMVRIGAGAVLIGGALLSGWVWTTWRIVVPPDKCLVMIRKTGRPPQDGRTIARAGEKGIQEHTLGPGQYFFNPWVWDLELVPLVTVGAGNPRTWRERFEEAGSELASPKLDGDFPQIGVIENKVGRVAPAGQDVVGPEFQGIQRDVLTPGTYRINPYVQGVTLRTATIVPLGYCGVVTSQVGDLPELGTVEEVVVGPDGQTRKAEASVVQKMAEPGQRGVLRNVLQPGIYYLNPYTHRVELVQIGYNQISQQRSTDMTTHISFPSKDGFNIDVEVTVVWGRHPAHTAEMINRFGDLEKLKLIILGQLRSICRNLGSEYESTDFIRGEKRELYQQAVTETLRRACHERDIEILIALISNIAVQGGESVAEGVDLKRTIQRGYIAREQDLTKQAQRESARVRAELETARALIEVAREQISADTRKKVAEIMADGQKKAREIEAQANLEVARIEREIAGLDAESTRVTGTAEARVTLLKNQAESDGQRMLVQAFGTGQAYNLYTFAQNFEPESINLIFAGEGTLWTDLKGLLDVNAAQSLQPAK